MTKSNPAGKKGKKTGRVSIDPKKWGKSAWTFIGHVVDSYGDKPTEKDKNEMKVFVRALGDNMPCETCRESFKIFIKKNSVQKNLGNQKQLKRWFEEYKASVENKNKKKKDP